MLERTGRILFRLVVKVLGGGEHLRLIYEARVFLALRLPRHLMLGLVLLTIGLNEPDFTGRIE